MTGRLALAVLLGTAILAGCGASEPTLVFTTPLPSPEAATAAPSPSPTPVPTPAPKPTPKPLYPSAWRVDSCRALYGLGLGLGFLGKAADQVYSGGWDAVRMNAAFARAASMSSTDYLLTKWAPAAKFRDGAESAAVAISAAAKAWDLAATFGTVGTATDAAAASLRASEKATTATTLFAALAKKYRFNCAGVTYPDS